MTVKLVPAALTSGASLGGPPPSWDPVQRRDFDREVRRAEADVREGSTVSSANRSSGQKRPATSSTTPYLWFVESALYIYVLIEAIVRRWSQSGWGRVFVVFGSLVAITGLFRIPLQGERNYRTRRD